MGIQNVVNCDVENTLIALGDRADKGTSEARVTAAVVAAIQFRRVVFACPGKKVKDVLDKLLVRMQSRLILAYKSSHIANQLALGALDTCAALADRLGDYGFVRQVQSNSGSVLLHADIVTLAVMPPSYSIFTIWWSTTSFSPSYTQVP